MKSLPMVALVALLFLFTAPANASALGDVTIEVDPASVDLDLGEATPIDVTVTNNGTTDLAGVVAHIDITDLTGSGSVDPEDWSSTLSKSISALEAGASRTLSWELQPISPGRFTLYAVALSPTSDSVAVSDTLTIGVADRRSLNPEGILPVALAAPALVGGALTFQIRRGRTRRSGAELREVT